MFKKIDVYTMIIMALALLFISVLYAVEKTDNKDLQERIKIMEKENSIQKEFIRDLINADRKRDK